ncbi:hypothetical protein BDR07DRAFT_1448984 [Suillus spraguei]|nr:hypothetical protein BDR07DRAFT_1448984 [Suillus spraguei]
MPTSSQVSANILHQLHKGVFHDHLLKWCTEIAGEDQIDEQYHTMTNYPGLQYFYFFKGISLMSQWTGTEHHEMQHVFLGVLAGAVQPTVFRAAHAFHAHKHMFKDLGMCDNFNIPKLHSMTHYIESIKSRGSANSFNTEFPEHLHINFAKNAYRVTNRRDYVVQMTKWWIHQEIRPVFCSPGLAFAEI